MRAILVSGKPGAGKSTVVRSLKATDLDDFGYHPNGNNDKWIIPPQLVERKMRDGGIFAGISNNIGEIAKLAWDKLIWLDVPEDELIRRIRKDKNQGRKARKTAWAKGPIPEGNWIKVDATLPIPELLNQIRSLFSGGKTP